MQAYSQARPAPFTNSISLLNTLTDWQSSLSHLYPPSQPSYRSIKLSLPSIEPSQPSRSTAEPSQASLLLIEPSHRPFQPSPSLIGPYSLSTTSRGPYNTPLPSKSFIFILMAHPSPLLTPFALTASIYLTTAPFPCPFIFQSIKPFLLLISSI